MQGRSVLLSSPSNDKWVVVWIPLGSQNEVEIIESRGAQVNSFHFSRKP